MSNAYKQYIDILNLCETQEEKDAVKRILENNGRLDEGLLDRILTRVDGTKSKLATIFKNIPSIVSGDPKGLKNPKAQKERAMVLKRCEIFNTRLKKVYKDFVTDLEFLFGEGLENASDETKKLLKNISGNLERIEKDNNNIKTNLEKHFKPGSDDKGTTQKKKSEPKKKTEPEKTEPEKTKPEKGGNIDASA
jgi:hypothetical protein